MKPVTKRQRVLKTVFSFLPLALLLFGGLSGHSWAQDEYIDVRLGLVNPANPEAPPDTRYLLNPSDPDADPIMAVVTIENVSNPLRKLLASKGYKDNLHLVLRFVDPDGLQITAQRLLPETYGKNFPTFPDVEEEENVPGEPVEEVPANDPIDPAKAYAYSTDPFNLRYFYDFGKAGRHTVKTFVSLGLYELYDEEGEPVLIEGTNFAKFWKRKFGGDIISNEVAITLIEDADGDECCTPEQHLALCPDQPLPDCEDRPAGADGVLGTADDGANLNPNRVEIPDNGLDDDCNPATLDVAVVVRGAIAVRVDKHTTGKGGSKEPIEKMDIRAYDKSAGSCAKDIGVAKKHHASVWETCPFDGVGTTDESGRANLYVAPGEYLLIGKCDGDENPNCAVETYIGSGVDEVVSGQTVEKYMQLIVKKDKKKKK